MLFLNGSLCSVQCLRRLSDLSGHIFQPLLLLCHLELGHSQMFFSAATLSTLHIGISGSFHIVEEIVLQDTVRCPQNFLALGGQKRIALFIQSNFGFPLFTAADLHNGLLDCTYKGLILAPLRPENLFFHHRDIDHMKVVVIHILPQSFRHGSVALIGVHDGREDILLTAHNLYGSFVCVGVELLGIFISAVIVKVSGVHIKNQFPVFHRIGFQTTGGDNAIGNHLIEHSGIAVGGSFEVDIPVGLGGINILVGVAVLFSFVMLLHLRHIIEGGQVLVTGKGAVDSVVSGHKNQLLSVVRQTAGGRGCTSCGKCNNPL